MAAWIVLGRMEPVPQPGSLTVFVAALLMAVIISLVAFYVLVGRPLRTLSRDMDEMVREHALQCSISFTRDEIDYINQGMGLLHEVASHGRERAEGMASIGELASSIAHDIKNPLAGISGAIQVLAEDFPEGDERGDIIREVLGEIERLDCSIKDLLSYARPPEPHPIPTHISNIVDSAVGRLYQEAQKYNVDVNIVTAGMSAMVDVDPDQVQSAMTHIMAFSIRTMQRGGELTIAIKLVENGSLVEVLIKDTGGGLDSEVLKGLFKPFRTSGYSSTGLSMAISKNLIERQGGRVEVQSSSGSGKIFRLMDGDMVADSATPSGTEFRITLPAHKENA